MILLLVLCVLAGLACLIGEPIVWLFAAMIGFICISIMIYVCYKKLQSIETKIDEMNGTDKSENNNK